MSKQYKLYLLEITPSSLRLLRWCMYLLKTKGEVTIAVPNALSPHNGGLNPFIGQSFSGFSVQSFVDLDHMLENMQLSIRQGDICIGIAHQRTPNLSQSNLPFVFVSECGSESTRASSMFGHEVRFKQDRLEQSLEAAVTRGAELSTAVGADKDIKDIATAVRGQDPGHIYFVVSSGITTAPPGTGLGQLCMHTLTWLYYIATTRGYDLFILGEQDIDKISPPRNSFIYGLSMNNAFKGGTAVIGQGFDLKTLLRIASFDMANPAVIITSLHRSEAQLYGQLSVDELQRLRPVKFGAFNWDGIQYLSKSGLSTGSDPWPIFIDKRLLQFNGKENDQPDKVQVLFQLDAQHRKNGEYVLSALIDACNLVMVTMPNIKIKLIIKATAAHAIPSKTYLEDLIETYGQRGKDILAKMEVHYQGIIGKEEWQEVIDTTDIGIFLSTEEGLHMFVGELWLGGAHCVISKPAAYPPFDKLPSGIEVVETYSVPSGGIGVYNDSFLTTVHYPSYGDSVKKIASSIISRRRSAPRSVEGEMPIITNLTQMANIVNLPMIETSRAPKVTYIGGVSKTWTQHL